MHVWFPTTPESPVMWQLFTCKSKLNKRVLCFGVFKNTSEGDIVCKLSAANTAQMGSGTENDVDWQDQSNLWEVWAEDMMHKR